MQDVIDRTETAKEAARRLAAPMLRKGFAPTGLHEYTSASGESLYWRIRAEHPSEPKWIRPMMQDEAGAYVMSEPPAPEAGKPLYRLHVLAQTHADVVVIVTEGEGKADMLERIGCTATTSGSASSAEGADWTPLRGRRVLIWPDHDDAGAKYAQAVAAKLQGIAVEVRVIDVATLKLPPKGDAVEWLEAHPKATATNVLALAVVSVVAPPAPVVDALPLLPIPQALERARALLLPPSEGTDALYPLESLGPLADAARELADGAQVSPAMAGQSLLAGVALLAQGVANVRTLSGNTAPLSLYALTVANSGDGKDTADRPALRPIHDTQREEGKRYAADLAAFEDAKTSRKKGDPAPQHPGPSPYRIASDLTIEGMRRSFAEGIAAQGIFSTEAGAVLAGHAMTPEQRTKTAANLCGLWDRGHLSVVRAGGGRTERYGVRLSAHLMIQPAALGDVLGDEVLSGIGFWPRFLLAWPMPLAPRTFRPWRPENSPVILRYWADCKRLLSRPMPDDCDGLPVIELDHQATERMAAFFESMEREGRQGALRDVQPFALRATEQACRIAGVLACFAGHDVVDERAAACGAALAAHSLDNWQSALSGKADPTPGWALALYRWLVERVGWVALKDIPRIGPANLRSAERRNTAIDLLDAAGLVDFDGGNVKAGGVDHASR
ncbi:conserved hypothetical protein [Thiomonas sp. X19]|uniref:DUF3987 domain-containing protein n=1 Tax=Thiomonas sp. X19 TaxID=1050370 RepID=UPI000B6CF1C1|nr:DUF3987 domain-containing protein [Thiomonas sp. X19]SCC95427.1 conserved hypothetical protein [Thiomonas sp. X19]